ncbi:hypothetical protein [Pseudonocardia zijingensis]|uniref:Uncharacterized protein n=1 Tax=Pseudonocardia zijingensis TaxID=153376 RepID=A0ABN1N8W5_9PSEU
MRRDSEPLPIITLMFMVLLAAGAVVAATAPVAAAPANAPTAQVAPEVVP